MPYLLKTLQLLLGLPKHYYLLKALLVINRLTDALSQITLTLALLPLSLIIATKDNVIQKESRSHQAILSRSALAFENGGTGRRTSNESLKETPIHTEQGLKRSSKP